MNLIPEIVIGKKYLWRGAVQERVCPGCGYIPGSNSVGQQMVVTVVSVPAYIRCFKCGARRYDIEGYYSCIPQNSRGQYQGIPYTQLEEIEEVTNA